MFLKIKRKSNELLLFQVTELHNKWKGLIVQVPGDTLETNLKTRIIILAAIH